MQRERKDVTIALLKKGFTDGKSDTDHDYYLFCDADGKKTSIFTKTSRGSKYKTLQSELLSRMAKQCKLSNRQFLELVDCTLSAEAYEAYLRDNGEI